MIRPFHTMPDIMELGLLVAKIQNGTGADREVDAAVMALFFTKDRRFIGARWADTNEPILDDVWVNPLTDKWSGTAARNFTSSFDDVIRTLREFLPETTWALDVQAELPARAIVHNGQGLKSSSALTPERALLTAFLVVADQLQRAS